MRRAKQFLGRFAPAKVVRARMHRRVFMQFAERMGLVYFGYVDQRNDEHRLVRGLTVSTRHHDNHYCIGSYDGYDVMLVERSDTLHFPGKPARAHTWIIMTFDLHTSYELPHIFLGLHSHNETFYAHLFTKFPALTKLNLGLLGPPDHHFASKYTLFAGPDDAISAEKLFQPEVTKIIADSFAGLTAEITEGSVYIYAETPRPNQQLLERILRNGLWLARYLDEYADKVLK